MVDAGNGSPAFKDPVVAGRGEMLTSSFQQSRTRSKSTILQRAQHTQTPKASHLEALSPERPAHAPVAKPTPSPQSRDGTSQAPDGRMETSRPLRRDHGASHDEAMRWAGEAEKGFESVRRQLKSLIKLLEQAGVLDRDPAVKPELLAFKTSAADNRLAAATLLSFIGGMSPDEWNEVHMTTFRDLRLMEIDALRRTAMAWECLVKAFLDVAATEDVGVEEVYWSVRDDLNLWRKAKPDV
ncbi:hypothetical protein B0H67DRAFT_644199 [Lasiosphaeris hirsuta]|uniref:Uncharacterized protein n=1 Tax=Lasiosphaeris hirsuta TaxID=260670 RepID=A0AA40E3B0_9PEZI|nr:hypothetical protein B0H67DRAFT_644199 [Lasiosphaeris hirsuta]